MEINVRFVAFQMMIVRVRIHVIQQQDRRFVRWVGREMIVTFEIHRTFH